MRTQISTEELGQRADNSLSAMPRPFLRWAGSKRAHLRQLLDVLPRSFNVYREPFLGGGSLFFLLQPNAAVLADSCAPLIHAYRAVRDGPRAVARRYDTYDVTDKEMYYRVRSMPEPTDRFERAARFIYLNRACWNGLYRVNSKGHFNVPYGKPHANTRLDVANLLQCSRALKAGVVLESVSLVGINAALLHVVAKWRPYDAWHMLFLRLLNSLVILSDHNFETDLRTRRRFAKEIGRAAVAAQRDLSPRSFGDRWLDHHIATWMRTAATQLRESLMEHQRLVVASNPQNQRQAAESLAYALVAIAARDLGPFTERLAVVAEPGWIRRNVARISVATALVVMAFLVSAVFPDLTGSEQAQLRVVIVLSAVLSLFSPSEGLKSAMPKL